MATINGALFGFFTYLTYNATNLVVSKGYHVVVATIDTAWGTSMGENRFRRGGCDPGRLLAHRLSGRASPEFLDHVADIDAANTHSRGDRGRPPLRFWRFWSRLQNCCVTLPCGRSLVETRVHRDYESPLLSNIYRDYIACLNKQDWQNLGQFVHEEVHYNGERIGLSGYREMLEGDFRAIPDI